MRARDKDQPQCFHGHSGQNEGRSRSDWRKQSQRRQDDPPSRQQQKKTRESHATFIELISVAPAIQAVQSIFSIVLISQNAIQNAYFRNKKFPFYLQTDCWHCIEKSWT
jgi:hypothetical protein